MLAVIALAGCRWPAEAQPYTSEVAQPTEEDRVDPPEHRALECTDEGFTVIVGPDPGCASIEGIFGRGTAQTRFGSRMTPEGEGTPLRVVRRGDRTVDVELAIRCRPFFNDTIAVEVREIDASRCSFETPPFFHDCALVPRFEATLLGTDADVLELELLGEGALADLHACARPDP